MRPEQFQNFDPDVAMTTAEETLEAIEDVGLYVRRLLSRDTVPIVRAAICQLRAISLALYDAADAHHEAGNERMNNQLRIVGEDIAQKFSDLRDRLFQPFTAAELAAPNVGLALMRFRLGPDQKPESEKIQ